MTARVLLLASVALTRGALAADVTVPSQCLVLSRVGGGRRAPLHQDAVEALIVTGTWEAPHAGGTIRLPDGSTRTWEALAAGPDGWFEGEALVGGYADLTVRADEAGVLLLHAVGHSMVYVNGEPRMGDAYQNGYVTLPVALHEGDNELLFAVGRGRLRVELTPPGAGAQFNTGDLTLPDLIVGEATSAKAGAIIINASELPLEGAAIEATLAGNGPRLTAVPTIPPLSARKVSVGLVGRPPEEGDIGRMRLRLLLGPARTVADAAVVPIRIRRPDQTYKRTFISEIDGSVQYYAVNPAQPARPDAPPPALFLTLHGAAVEAIGQADAYSPKSWGHLVAPTNRRPFGFDWEDWGRWDAMEVLDLAQHQLHTDPWRTYLTGHSMGGHGVWHLGLTFPDRFAAIGPSAGWVSFMSYGGGQAEPGGPMQELLARAQSPSDTLSLLHNAQNEGVYILHGEKDNNVPVTEARTMRDALAAFHRDLLYFEQPGAGHWWDATDEPGSDCVDWAPMFDLFGRRAIPANEAVRQVDFVTASPGVSAECHWARIEAQQQWMKPSTISLRCDPGRRRFSGTTGNVARLSLSVRHLRAGAPLQAQLDGQTLGEVAWPGDGERLWLACEGGVWSATSAPPPKLKSPERCGPFREVFRRNALFVYGTRGAAEENAWAFAKARYDAEQFWYRGNGGVEVIADSVFDAAGTRERNVVLYGNAETNGAWAGLLGASPVQVRRDGVQIGDRVLEGTDLACLVIRPREGSRKASVGAVAGTGLAGMRLTDRLPYFVAGAAYPDCIVLAPESLAEGLAGVRAAGYFGGDWSVDRGEFAWGEGR